MPHAKGRVNLAQEEPFYIDHASKDGRLYLVRTIGPLSGGTRVTLVRADQNYSELVVEAFGHQIAVENRDLVIRKTGKRKKFEPGVDVNV